MKAYILFVFSLLTIAGYSQNTINNYKYVIVPAKFDFSSEDNQYGLNTTAKFLLEQKGFITFLSNEKLPPMLAGNKCNALMAEVVLRKGFFATNLTLLLKDCQGNIIYKGKEGKSREKEFQTAYDEALRLAFASLKDVPYNYDSTNSIQAQQGAAAAVTPAAAMIPASTTASTSMPAAAYSAPASAVPVSASNQAGISGSSAVVEISGTLYAQTIPNGYQLIDTTPKKVLTLLKTSLQDYFIAVSGVSNGIVFKKNGEWYFEYYKEDKLVSQRLEIKF